MNRSLLNYRVEQTRRDVWEIRRWFLAEARMYHGEKPIPSTLTWEDIEHWYRLLGWMLSRWREHLRNLKEIQQSPEDETIRHLERYKVLLEAERAKVTVKERCFFVEMRMKEIEKILA